MKVLKKGRPQSGWSMEATCTGKGNGDGGCGAKLLVEQADLYETRAYHYGDDGPDRYVTFRCPCCSVQTDLENVPMNVREKLPYRTQTELNGGGMPNYVYRSADKKPVS